MPLTNSDILKLMKAGATDQEIATLEKQSEPISKEQGLRSQNQPLYPELQSEPLSNVPRNVLGDVGAGLRAVGRGLGAAGKYLVTPMDYNLDRMAASLPSPADIGRGVSGLARSGLESQAVLHPYETLKKHPLEQALNATMLLDPLAGGLRKAGLEGAASLVSKGSAMINPANLLLKPVEMAGKGLASYVAKQVDKDVLAAAKRSGMEKNLPISAVTKSEPIKTLESFLSSVSPLDRIRNNVVVHMQKAVNQFQDIVGMATDRFITQDKWTDVGKALKTSFDEQDDAVHKAYELAKESQKKAFTDVTREIPFEMDTAWEKALNQQGEHTGMWRNKETGELVNPYIKGTAPTRKTITEAKQITERTALSDAPMPMNRTKEWLQAEIDKSVRHGADTKEMNFLLDHLTKISRMDDIEGTIKEYNQKFKRSYENPVKFSSTEDVKLKKALGILRDEFTDKIGTFSTEAKDFLVKAKELKGQTASLQKAVLEASPSVVKDQAEYIDALKKVIRPDMDQSWIDALDQVVKTSKNGQEVKNSVSAVILDDILKNSVTHGTGKVPFIDILKIPKAIDRWDTATLERTLSKETVAKLKDNRLMTGVLNQIKELTVDKSYKKGLLVGGEVVGAGMATLEGKPRWLSVLIGTIVGNRMMASETARKILATEWTFPEITKGAKAVTGARAAQAVAGQEEAK